MAMAAAALAACALLAGCMATYPVAGGPASPRPGDRGSTGTTPRAAPSAEASQEGAVAAMVELANRHRRQMGCAPLVWDEAAARVAQAHSADMARRNYFAHQSPEGRSMADRLSAAGLAYRAAGENLAHNPGGAEATFRAWLGSPGHRANLEQCQFTHHGVGHAAGRWTHVFYTPLRG